MIHLIETQTTIQFNNGATRFSSSAVIADLLQGNARVHDDTLLCTAWGYGQWWPPSAPLWWQRSCGTMAGGTYASDRVTCFFSLLCVVLARFEPKTELKKPALNSLVPCAVTNRSARGFQKPKFLIKNRRNRTKLSAHVHIS